MSSSVIPATTPVSWTKVPDGTAALPSFAFTNSQGTGFYRVSADVLGLSTAGVQRVVVDASGNVGIGTASPAQKLHIASGGVIRLNRADNNAIAYGEFNYGGSGVGFQWNDTNSDGYTFKHAGTTVMRIDSSGNLLVGISSGSSNTIQNPGQTQGNTNLFITNTCYFFVSAGAMGNAAATAMRMNANTTTSRSINASGTINANGADYAEYMTKAGDFTIAKGDICGINAEGKLTKTFSEAVTFVVKSTNPSYVGGDSWGAGLEANSEELEAARQLVDRIAFCGQVPVNVLEATPGQWIIPIEDNDEIKGEAVSNPSFEQYQKAVGKVIAIEQDGRARIIVKVA